MRRWPSATTCSTASAHPLAVVDRDRRQALVLEAAVDEHDRLGELARLVDELAVEARGRGDEAVDLAGAHRLEVLALAVRVVVGVGDQRRVAGRAEAVLDPAHDRREERVREVGSSTPTVNERFVFSPRAIGFGR